MAKSENKTKPTKASVKRFIAGVENETRRKDALVLLDLMSELSGEKPKMCGPSIVGFGTYHYKYESGREGDSVRLGFSPRKANMVIYVMPGFKEMGALLEGLGKHRTGSSCLYINKLADVDEKVLKKICKKSWAIMKKRYPAV